MTFAAEKTFTLEGIRIPDTRLAREITQFVRDTESGLLFHHSSRVYYWGALAGKRRGLKFDHELLYAGAMFHDMGLTPAHSSAHERFRRRERRPRLPQQSRHWPGRHRYGVDGDRLAHDAGHPSAHAPRRRSGDGRRRDGRAGADLCRIQRR